MTTALRMLRTLLRVPAANGRGARDSPTVLSVFIHDSIFVPLLLYIHPSLENERLEAIASLILVVVAAAAFVAVGVVEETIAFYFGNGISESW